jgi:hypothetical protein
MIAKLACLALALGVGASTQKGRADRGSEGPAAGFSAILGRPTANTVTLSVLSAEDLELRVEHGAEAGEFTFESPPKLAKAGSPVEFELDGLAPNTLHRYRLSTRAPGAAGFAPREEATFRTARAPGAAFTFAVQGDSHPERPGKMFSAELYVRTLREASVARPDFYFLLGDDFSIERLIERDALSQAAVDQVYARQRGFLGELGRSAALFLVNGNHEQAARYLLDGKESSAAVLAARARNRFYPLPAPNDFYSGDTEPVAHVGLLRDYYAWTWGDGLFVVIDPYWHSAVAVDNEASGGAADERGLERGAGRSDAPARERGGKKPGKGGRDPWLITLGEAQYRWLAKTLSESRARWKFVFAHHVNGTGRGAIELARQFEWGGQDNRGVDRFAEHRPGWELPIHGLFVKHGVTIFFQGHDHLYARQELDGVVYQEVPNPADDTYQAFNSNAYRSGEILPNSGHLRVTVAAESVRVDYVRSFLPRDESEGRKQGSIAASYTLAARAGEAAK